MSVDAGLRYASCVVELPADPDRTWDTAVCQDQPVNAKTGVLVGIEDNKWQASLQSVQITPMCSVYQCVCQVQGDCRVLKQFFKVLKLCAS